MLSRRETAVLAAMTNLARSLGRWPTVRETGEYIAEQEGKSSLSVASTFRALAAKGYLVKDGSGYAILGYRVRVKSAEVVRG